MSKAYLKHQERINEVRSFGRMLARRSKSSCELCQDTGVRLDPVEVPPEPEEPDVERCLFVCERCKKGMEGGPLEPNAWRFLEGSMWSALAPAQVVSVRLLRRLADHKQGAWARDALEGLYLEPEIEEWANSG